MIPLTATPAERRVLLFEQAGEALFGPLWVIPLAEMLGVSERSVHYWRAGVRLVPEWVWKDLYIIAERREAEIQATKKELFLVDTGEVSMRDALDLAVDFLWPGYQDDHLSKRAFAERDPECQRLAQILQQYGDWRAREARGTPENP